MAYTPRPFQIRNPRTVFTLPRESRECVVQDWKLFLHMKMKQEYCLGRVGMDSGTREVEVRLSPVAGHSGQERESEVWEERERGFLCLVTTLEQ